jgi:predicted O-linked N-acetylglucosamine transferase (SPINDLY family)
MGPVVLCPIGALEDEAVFERIRKDEIDVLIEASGHLGGGRLAILAAKAAPVQVSWTPAGLTTGLPSVDYVLLADGTGQTGPQAETRWPIGPVQTPFVARPALAQTKSEGAEAPGQRFGCLAHPADLDAATIDLFAQVMRSCGGASLGLNHANFRDPVVQNTACAIFAARGIDPDRLVFPDPVVISASDPVRPSLDPQTDMMLAPVCGIGLCDPDLLVGLSHGIPVLWLASFKPNVPNPLAALGLLDFMATDEADFVAKALDWMQRRASGGPERQALANRFAASAYGNLTAFTRRLELAYCLMFDVWSSSHAEPERIVTMHQWRVPSRHVLKRMA